MKNVWIVALLFLCCWGPGCKKHDDCLQDAVITGYDFRKCACCGGLMINFENNPTPYAGAFSLVSHLPEGTGIDANSTFPVYVRVAYLPVSNEPCGNSKVNITRLEKK